MEGHITISTIAKAVGVSGATVHRALYGKPGVSPAVATEIRRLAEELGYQPGKQSATTRRKPVCLVAAFPEAEGSNRFFYSQLWEGTNSCLDELKAYHLDIHRVSYSDTPGRQFPETLRRILRDTRGDIDGIITGGRIFKEGFAMLHRLQEGGVPVVLVSEDDPQGTYLFCAQSDGQVDGQLAAELLVSQTRPGEAVLMCAGDVLLHSNRSCMLGFEQYLNQSPSSRRLIKIHGYPEQDGVRDELRRVLANDPSVRALYSVNLRCSLVMAQVVEELGLSGKVRLVGSDLCAESALYMKRGTMTAILFRNPRHQGWLGAKRLTDWLLHRMPPPGSMEYVRSSIILKSNLEQYL